MGTFAEALTITDNAQGSPHSVALAGTGAGPGPGFTISGGSSPAAVSPGGTASYQLSVSPTGGSFANAVTFACNGAPAFATCMVNPSSIVPGSNSSTVNVTVKTTGTVAEMRPTAKRNWFLASWIFAPMGLFGMFSIGDDRRKKIARHAVLSTLMVAFLLLAGCGGGVGSSRSTPVAQVTPPGTYTLTVVGTSGKTEHSVSLRLQVQ